MCTICQAFKPYQDADDCDYLGLNAAVPGPEGAAFFEGADAPENTSTPYTISVGDTFDGTLTFLGDRDWVALNVVSGQSYNIDLYGIGGGAVGDTYMRLYDSAGTYMGFDDDGGAGLSSNAWFTAEYTGVIYISAGSWDDTETGDYQISVTAASARTEFTLDQIADQLTTGYWTSSTVESSARRFNASVGDTIDVHIGGLNADGQQLAVWAFEAWSAVSGLNFNLVTAGAANASHEIVIDDNASGAYNSSTHSGGFIIQSNINVSTGWLATYGTTVDSYSFQTYMHEIGHALGLGHAGDYNGSATWNIDQLYLNDSWQATVMSYFSQNENPYLSNSYGFTTTLMMADILAIQDLYGSNVVTNAGDTTYGWNNNIGGYLGNYMTDATSGTTSIYNDNNFSVYTLYDTGGVDTFDYSGSSFDNFLDMNDETYSNLSGRTGNFAIARDVELENAILGTGNDTVEGNELANDVEGGDGADSLVGNGGADTLDGGAGEDTLEGGDGIDSLVGGTERDLLIGGDEGDRLRGGTGRDTLLGESGDDRLEGGRGRDRIEGSLGDDRLFGQTGHDNIFGGRGEDRIDGGSENDRLSGGRDSDLFVFSGVFGDDTITDFDATDNDEDIDLSGVASITDYADLLANHIDDSSGTVIIDDGAGNTITLTGITSIGQLDAGDFLF